MWDRPILIADQTKLMNSKPSNDRVFNFSAGPAALPVPVLEQAQRDLLSLPGCGASVMEISHRSKPFVQILEQTIDDLSSLLQLPKGYRILFLQGGARLQFSMIPMNLLRGIRRARRLHPHGLLEQEAPWRKPSKEGEVQIAWDGKADNYDHLPSDGDLKLSDSSAYVYFASNETIQGVQFADEPHVGDRPLVCDASSDFLSRPLAMESLRPDLCLCPEERRPSGRDDRDDPGRLVAPQSRNDLPGYLNFATHAEHNSMYNTPPTFAVYLVGLVAKWLLNEIGGLEAMHAVKSAESGHVVRCDRLQ